MNGVLYARDPRGFSFWAEFRGKKTFVLELIPEWVVGWVVVFVSDGGRENCT